MQRVIRVALQQDVPRRTGADLGRSLSSMERAMRRHAPRYSRSAIARRVEGETTMRIITRRGVFGLVGTAALASWLRGGPALGQTPPPAPPRAPAPLDFP